MKRTTYVFASLLLAGFSTGQPLAPKQSSANTLKLADGATSPKAKIGELAWLAGLWEGSGLGGVSREIWAPPQTDRMYGTFTLEKEGKLVFSEAMLLVEEAGSVVLKIKHFNPDFTGWEEKDGFVRFPLVRLGEHSAYFGGLTLRRQGESLTVYLVLTEGEERTEHVFSFERVPL